MRKHYYLKYIKASLLFFVIFIIVFININQLEYRPSFKTNPNQLIYKVNDRSEAEILALKYHLRIKDISPNRVVTFETTPLTDIEALLTLGCAYNSINYVSAPPKIRTADPYLKNQYALQMMQTNDAWNITTGSPEVNVAIIDTGIDTTHDEFKNRISALSYNVITTKVGIDEVKDDHGHGTMVAGIIGAIKDNSKGIAGIAQNVKLMIIKANNTNEGSFNDSAITDGIYYATDNGADIINLSLGGSYANPQTKAALDYAKSKGVIVVAAAGNDGNTEKFYPAAFETAVSVSAVDSTKTLASFSNYGETIDIAAPGASIITTVRNNGYGTVSGTSFAAPQVSGVLALMISHFGKLSPQELTTQLLYSTVDVGTTGKDNLYGYGIVNTLNALTYEFANILFETFEGSKINPITLRKNTTLNSLPVPILKDHIFEGWFKDINLTNPWQEDIDVVTNDLTLYAKFNSSFHTVKFITDGSLVASMVVEHGATFALPDSYLENYTFEGWTIDEEHEIYYTPAPVLKDLTLYAHFKPIIYHNISLFVDGNFFDLLSIKDGSSFLPPDITKTGYTFDGWYTDELYTIVYEEKTIETNNILYARFIPNIYTITFKTIGSPVDDLQVSYGNTFELPTTSHESQTFIDWYLDSSYTTIYSPTTVANDLTLYARFAKDAYLVSYLIDNKTISNHWVELGDRLDPIIPSKIGFLFSGWYYDIDFINPYQNEPVLSNLSLYGKFDLKTYTATFYDSDDKTILFQTTVSAGASIIPPAGPNKPSSSSFHYTFKQWSSSLELVNNDLDIYPIYSKTFRPESVSLKPGIDTIKENEKWNDEGVLIEDETLTVLTINNVNSSQLGRYVIIYQIYDNDILLLSRVRIVQVIETQPTLEITLNEGITTIPVGSEYFETGAQTNIGTIEIVSNVDTSISGTYQIKYQVEINDIIYEKTRYVYVIESKSNLSKVSSILKKERDYLVA